MSSSPSLPSGWLTPRLRLMNCSKPRDGDALSLPVSSCTALSLLFSTVSRLAENDPPIVVMTTRSHVTRSFRPLSRNLGSWTAGELAACSKESAMVECPLTTVQALGFCEENRFE
jgi:hypothetical protein